MTFRNDIEGWSAIAPQLFIWDYVTNFRNVILPHPNQRVIAPNVRFFVENNCIGLFEQGDAYSTCGDFVELRAWVLAKLMWDPSRDERALVTEFLEGYYGAAASPLQAYLDLIHDAVEKAGTYLRCYMQDTSAWLPTEDLLRAAELFDAAAARVAGDPVLCTRVRRARMPLDHAWLQRYHSVRRRSRLAGTPFSGPHDPKILCEDFIQRAHEFKNKQYAEGRPFGDLEASLRAQFLDVVPATPPAICAGLAEKDWLDIQEHEFRLYKPGEWVRLVADAEASNGKAAAMPGNHTQWAVQCPLGPELAEFSPWHCYVVARCEMPSAAAGKDGPAFRMGLYDQAHRRGIASKAATLMEAADGAYRTYDLGVHDLNGGIYFWAAPVDKPRDVERVWIDRFLLVREVAREP